MFLSMCQDNVGFTKSIKILNDLTLNDSLVSVRTGSVANEILLFPNFPGILIINLYCK